MTSCVVRVELSNWSHLLLPPLRLVSFASPTGSSCWICKSESRRTIMTLWWRGSPSGRWVWVHLVACAIRSIFKIRIAQVGRSEARARIHAQAEREHPRFFKNSVWSTKFGSGKKRLHSSFNSVFHKFQSLYAAFLFVVKKYFETFFLWLPAE